MKMPVTLGGRMFTTKRIVKITCQSILRSYTDGDRVSELDARFLADLLSHHPDAARKIGPGIAGFHVRRNVGYPSTGFFVTRVDGTETDFSFNECLRPSDHRNHVLFALRHAVIHQVASFKAEKFADGEPVPCAITGELLHDAADAHVDHDDPIFVDLATAFVVSNGGWSAFQIFNGDGVVGARLVDDVATYRWQEYHRQFARLRITSAQANLMRGADRD